MMKLINDVLFGINSACFLNLFCSDSVFRILS
jgi:hypothetical protein